MQSIADTLNSFIGFGDIGAASTSTSTATPTPSTSARLSSSSASLKNKKAPRRGILYYRRYPYIRFQNKKKQVHFLETSLVLKKRRKTSVTSQKWQAYVAEQFRTLQKQRRLRERQREREMARDRALKSRRNKRKRASSATELTAKEEDKLINRLIENGRKASSGSIQVKYVPRASDTGGSKRPPNAFLVFAQHARREFYDLIRPVHCSSASIVLGQAWRYMSKFERQAFYEEANRLRTEYFETKRQQQEQEAQKPKTKRPVNAFVLFCQEQRSQSDPKIRKRSPRCFMSLMGRKWNRMSSNKKQQYFDKAKELLQHYIENQPAATEDTGTSRTQYPDFARTSGLAATEDTGTSKTQVPDLARSSGLAATEDTGTSKTQDPDVARSSGFAATEDTGTSKTPYPDLARSSGFAATEDTGTSKTPYPDLARSSGFAATEDTGTSKTQDPDLARSSGLAATEDTGTSETQDPDLARSSGLAATEDIGTSEPQDLDLLPDAGVAAEEPLSPVPSPECNDESQHEPAESGDRVSMRDSTVTACQKREPLEVPRKKARYERNCNNTLQNTDTDTDGCKSQVSVTFNIPSSSSDPTSSTTSEEAGPIRVESEETTKTESFSKGGILSTVKRETTAVTGYSTTPSDSSTCSVTLKQKRVKRRRKRPRRCPIVKKRVTWREVSDEGVQDEFTSQILVDGLLKNEPLVVREITGTSSCCRVTPYSRNVMSRVEQKFEIDKVFADAEVYFTASSGSFDSPCDICLESSSLSSDDDDDDEDYLNLLSSVDHRPRVKSYCRQHTDYFFGGANNSRGTSDRQSNNTNQHSRADHTSSESQGSNNRDPYSRAAEGSHETSESNVHDVDARWWRVLRDPSSSAESGKRGHFPFTCPVPYLSSLQRKFQRQSRSEFSTPLSHGLGKCRHSKDWQNLRGLNRGNSSGGQRDNITCTANVGHTNTTRAPVQDIFEKGNFPPESAIAAQENAGFKMTTGFERGGDNVDDLEKNGKGASVGYSVNNTGIPDGANELGKPNHFLGTQQRTSAAELTGTVSMSGFHSNADALSDKPRAKGDRRDKCVPDEILSPACHRCSDTRDQSSFSAGDLLGGHDLLDLVSASMSDSSLDLFVLESLDEEAPVSASMYTLWNDAAFSKDFPGMMVGLSGVQSQSTADLNRSASKASLSSVGGLHSCPDATCNPQLHFNDFGDCRRRHTSVSKHKQSQALKRKNPDPPHTTNVNELSSSIHTLDFTSYKKPLVTAARANSLQSFVANTGIKHPSADGNEEEKDLYGIIGLAASLDSLILSDHDLWYRKLKRLT